MFIEPDSLAVELKLLTLCLSFLGFSVVFVCSWIFLLKRFLSFAALTQAMKADTCSRINSTLHSFIIVPGLIYGLATTKWNGNYEPETSVARLQVFLCITVGYFTCDTVVLFMYRVPLWGVFVVHHLVASTPYVVYLFIAKCPYGVFVLSMFLLVEFSNISLNTQAFLEQHGMGDTKWYAIAFYTTFIGWIFCRLLNPMFLVFTVHTKVFPAIKESNGSTGCLVPGAICGWLIMFFCIGVFIFVLCKELRLRWKKAPKIDDVARIDETRAVNIGAGHVHMTQDEMDLTLPSPTRMLLFEAREVAHEIEERVLDLEKHGRVTLLGEPSEAARRHQREQEEQQERVRSDSYGASGREMGRPSTGE